MEPIPASIPASIPVYQKYLKYKKKYNNTI